MTKKKLYSEEILNAKKQLTQLTTLKGKVSALTEQWEGLIGANIPDYSVIVDHLEKVERQIYEQIGSWKRTPAI